MAHGKHSVHPSVAIASAQRALDALSKQLTNPDPRFTAEYTVDLAKALQSASYTLFNICRARSHVVSLAAQHQHSEFAKLQQRADDLATIERLHKRRIRIKSAAKRAVQCADCGEVGEITGHQTCQYPQDH